ncbi:YlmH/Sll1252 family protein [Ihubacter massiliensis]|uniref:YlmH/Sll1252 family protein n=1 Tax=Hominibacterium faecale TaxID=2839743 RepID=A0A9J6QWE4_9FIRM|nr:MULTISPECIES: YlmH/Sll1252 family protein [Eubacteriales Family XIII. Incertae Sedis]MCO7123528.1 YlmH/Sll1252 family protein [Ihubacter massiliensis]MCU7379558.1 YlmH/Sll1252 family protein [Hominibacterium faecale]
MNESKEDKMLLAGAEDKYQQCSRQYMVTSTGFLDLRQRALVEGRLRELSKASSDVSWAFFGGYEDAERTIAMFLPDYASLEENHPLAVIRAEAPSGGRKLTHRDYLGSLTGLGIKREKIGDILTNETGADILILEEIRDFLLFHYEKAGRTSLKLESVPLSELRIPEQKTSMQKDTVASLRLDNVIASAFSLSRAKAAEAIRSGLVFVNSMQAEKTDFQVKEGDKLVLRGKGKAFLREVGQRTRKDRIFIVTERYL